MNINPIKSYYVTTTDETTILYETIKFNKVTAHYLTFKGRYFDKIKPTVDNCIEKIKIELKKEEKDVKRE